MIKDFRHACIVVKDLNRSLKFYRDILGLKVFKICSVRGRYPQAVFNIKGVKLTYVKMYAPNQSRDQRPVFELHCWRKPRILPKKGYQHISFSVKDIDYEYNRLTKLGLKFISRPVSAPNRKTKICFVYDPDNNLIELIEDAIKK